MPGPQLQQAGNGVWYVHWTEGRRSKRVSTRSRDLAAAKGFLAKWLTLETTGRDSPELTCEAAWTIYYDGHVLRKVVAVDRQDAIWKNLKGFFGELPVKAVTQALVDEYTARRMAGFIGRKSRSVTVRKEIGQLTTSWRYCAKVRAIAADELPYIELPENAAPRERWLSASEIDLLVATAEKRRVGKGTSRKGAAERLSRLERFVWLGLHTAARRRAIETLQWDQVDWQLQVIHYQPAGRNQTKKRKVSVPISDALLPVLQRAYKERKGDYVLDHSGSIRKAFDACVDACGLYDVNRHTLRHTAATHMARRGVSLWIIAGILGNTIEMVTRVYAKHCPDTLREGVNAIAPKASVPDLEAAE